MQTIVLLSQKGGSGKTTLAVHIAAEAAAAGQRTLLIDLDPQASAALWGDRRGDRPPDVVVEHPARLEGAMEAAGKAGYEMVVIDTAPHADQAALRSAKVSDLIIVPCRPATFDLGGVKATLEICDLARRRPIVVLNAAPIRSRIVMEAANAIRDYGGTVSDHIIRHRVAYQHCLINGDTAAEYEPGGAAAAEITALFMNACLREYTNAGIHDSGND